MTIEDVLHKISNEPLAVEFDEVIAAIDAHYHYTPTAFTNGALSAPMTNAAGENTGSCKIFCFAQKWGLSEAQTLACFGHYYRNHVLPHPEGHDHPNIRLFVHDGWAGIEFHGDALTPRTP